MESTVLLAVPLGVLVGLIVGAVGGGGAILALPIFIYVLGQGVGPATTASLVVVSFAAAIGAGAQGRSGQVCWRLAAVFAGPATVGAGLGTLAGAAVSGRVLVLSFIPVMLLAALATWRRAAGGGADRCGGCPTDRIGRAALAGLGVGVLTGFFGVGGGFLIVPVLTIGLGLGFRRAVATSLVIISITAAGALISHLSVGARLDLPITLTLAASTGVGALVGVRIGGRLPQATLARGFSLLVVAIALLLLADALFFGGPPSERV